MTGLSLLAELLTNGWTPAVDFLFRIVWDRNSILKILDYQEDKRQFEDVDCDPWDI